MEGAVSTLRDPVEGEEEVDAEDVGQHGSVLLDEEDGDAPEHEPTELQNQRSKGWKEKEEGENEEELFG
jgi:hypothetical protein